MVEAIVPHPSILYRYSEFRQGKNTKSAYDGSGSTLGRFTGAEIVDEVNRLRSQPPAAPPEAAELLERRRPTQPELVAAGPWPPSSEPAPR
jgi:hypothetical protein